MKKRRLSWLLGMLLGSLLLHVGGARAESEVSTIYLNNGGKIRGEIVLDMPDAPLTVMVAGQAVQVARDTILRIDSGAPSPADPAVTQAAPSTPVAPVAAPVPVVAPAPATGMQLQYDRRGRAMIDSSWSPEMQRLVMERNDVALSVRRKGFTMPILMMTLGVVGYIGTAAGAAAASASYLSCVNDDPLYASDCSNSSHKIALAGYTISSLLMAGGTAFLVVRILRRSSMKRRLAGIDARLREFNVQPLAAIHPQTNRALAGLNLSAHF